MEPGGSRKWRRNNDAEKRLNRNGGRGGGESAFGRGGAGGGKGGWERTRQKDGMVHRMSLPGSSLEEHTFGKEDETEGWREEQGEQPFRTVFHSCSGGRDRRMEGGTGGTAVPNSLPLLLWGTRPKDGGRNRGNSRSEQSSTPALEDETEGWREEQGEQPFRTVFHSCSGEAVLLAEPAAAKLLWRRHGARNRMTAEFHSRISLPSVPRLVTEGAEGMNAAQIAP
ncbi:uncharacterized protein LOC120017640 [Salvelinus namaycush]|uniref:Uncharacterized protein LOC120017640 n=1 Tax=Salvelinus namaycush TaxID=8040 RepID=A0A8U0P1J5_SALNM|nr:uncharacterized protein LOC120017640 [Salvelinus namaycush]